MKVITLRGKPNSGETWTLRKVHELMLEKDFKQVPEMYKDLGNDDFLDILRPLCKPTSLQLAPSYLKNRSL